MIPNTNEVKETPAGLRPSAPGYNGIGAGLITDLTSTTAEVLTFILCYFIVFIFFIYFRLHDHLKHQPYSFSSDISDYVEQLNNTVTSISTGEKIIPQKEKRGGSGRLGPDTGDWSQLVISKGVRTVQGRRRSITRCDGVAD